MKSTKQSNGEKSLHTAREMLANDEFGGQGNNLAHGPWMLSLKALQTKNYLPPEKIKEMEELSQASQGSVPAIPLLPSDFDRTPRPCYKKKFACFL